MKAVANSHSKRSLQQFEEALVKYTPQVRATARHVCGVTRAAVPTMWGKATTACVCCGRGVPGGARKGEGYALIACARVPVRWGAWGRCVCRAAQLREDPIINSHVSALYDNLLEQ